MNNSWVDNRSLKMCIYIYTYILLKLIFVCVMNYHVKSMKLISELVIGRTIRRLVYYDSHLFLLCQELGRWVIVVYHVMKNLTHSVVDVIHTGINTNYKISIFVVGSYNSQQHNSPIYEILVDFEGYIKVFTSLGLTQETGERGEEDGRQEQRLARNVNVSSSKLIDVVFFNSYYYVLTSTNSKLCIQCYRDDWSLLNLSVIPDNILPPKNRIDTWRLAILDNGKVMLLADDRDRRAISHIANIHNDVHYNTRSNAYENGIVFVDTPTHRILTYTFDKMVTNNNLIILYSTDDNMLQILDSNFAVSETHTTYAKDISSYGDRFVILNPRSRLDIGYVDFYYAPEPKKLTKSIWESFF